MIKAIVTICTLLLFIGCGAAKEEARSLIEDGRESVEKTVEEAQIVKEKAGETMEKIDSALDTAQNVRDAIKGKE